MFIEKLKLRIQYKLLHFSFCTWQPHLSFILANKYHYYKFNTCIPLLLSLKQVFTVITIYVWIYGNHYFYPFSDGVMEVMRTLDANGIARRRRRRLRRKRYISPGVDYCWHVDG